MMPSIRVIFRTNFFIVFSSSKPVAITFLVIRSNSGSVLVREDALRSAQGLGFRALRFAALLGFRLKKETRISAHPSVIRKHDPLHVDRSKLKRFHRDTNLDNMFAFGVFFGVVQALLETGSIIGLPATVR